MAFLPIIYTSLLVVFGLFIIVFSVSYISFKFRKKEPVRATINKVPMKKQLVHERAKNFSMQNMERSPISNQAVLRINENKQINVIKREAEVVHKYRPQKRNRFSIINAADTRKFNQFSESVEINSFPPTQTLSIESYRGLDLMKFYDE